MMVLRAISQHQNLNSGGDQITVTIIVWLCAQEIWISRNFINFKYLWFALPPSPSRTPHSHTSHKFESVLGASEPIMRATKHHNHHCQPHYGESPLPPPTLQLDPAYIYIYIEQPIFRDVDHHAKPLSQVLAAVNVPPAGRVISLNVKFITKLNVRVWSGGG